MSVICFLQLASIMFSGCIINRQEDESEDLDPLITNEDQSQPTQWTNFHKTSKLHFLS